MAGTGKRGRPPKSLAGQQKAKIQKKKEEPVKLQQIYCLKCGNNDSKQFFASKDPHRSFFGKVQYCKDCVKNIFLYYMTKYQNDDVALYYTCRKIDIPYIHANYLGAKNNINNPNARITGEEGLLSAYMKGMSFAESNGWGTCFDDSQGESEVAMLGAYDIITKIKRNKLAETNVGGDIADGEDYEIVEYDTAFLQAKWGNTFDNWQLQFLENEYLDWDEKLNGISDKTLEILVKQICYQLLDIYVDRQSGTPVDKKIKTLRELMNDSGLMEKQNKASQQKKNVGMTIRDIEFHRPVTTSTEIFDDVDGLKNYIFGATGCYFKAAGMENEYTKFYDKWMEEYSVDVINDLLENKKKETALLAEQENESE